MLTETTITLYNKYIDKTTLKECYKKTIITKDSLKTGATWHGEKLATVSTTEAGKGSVNIADIINIRIPIINNFSDKTYISPKDWLRLTDSDRDKYFTFQTGDRIVKGECAYEFSNTNLITKLDAYDNAVSIMSIKINDYGSKSLQHYMIGGK
jgi:hypothetical protein